MMVAILLSMIDFLSKEVVFTFLQKLQHEKYVTSFFNLVIVKNHGISFGLLGELPSFILILLNSVIVVYIIFCLNNSNHRLYLTAITLIIGGALGNITDRILNKHVRDFIDIHYQNFHWPAFNFADTFVCIGVIILIIVDVLCIVKNSKHVR